MLPPLLRLVLTLGIYCLPSCDWFSRGAYAPRRIIKTEKDLDASEAEIMKEVQKALKSKLGQTLQAASVLDKKLRNGYKEIDSAARVKDRLVQALDGKVRVVNKPLITPLYH
eukprot:7369223-Pyramimonas_sp.AAC.1